MQKRDNRLKTNLNGWGRAMGIEGWQCQDCRTGIHENHKETAGQCSDTKWRNIEKGRRELIYCWCPMRKLGSYV